MDIVGLHGGAVSVGQLKGTVVSKVSLQGTLVSKASLIGTVCMPAKLGTYNGDYVVTPDLTGRTLPTKDKSMIDDVVVKPIPIYEVSNTHGITVIIGGELNVQKQSSTV
jgi:hypothetical protein